MSDEDLARAGRRDQHSAAAFSGSFPLLPSLTDLASVDGSLRNNLHIYRTLIGR